MGHIAHLRKIFTCFQYHFINLLLSPLVEGHGSLFLKNLNFLYPRMLYAKFSWNWPCSSEVEIFLIFSIYFYDLLLSPHEEGCRPLFEQT